MRFDVLTLFPELFAAHAQHGVTRRAFDSKQVDVRLWQLRQFGAGLHQRVDDRPFGGGPGMVMQAPVLASAMEAVRADRAASGAADAIVGANGGTGLMRDATSAAPRVPLILLTPTGQPMTQALVRDVAAGHGAVLLCGRYEGIDQRFVDREVDLQISLGDFVLSGGEIPALALLDAVARLQTGVLNDPQSHEQDSFGVAGLLDHPHYTQPSVWDGVSVPAVLASGHHAQIDRWRREQALEATARQRPDLLLVARRQGHLSRLDEAFLAGLGLKAAE